ncbi:MAG: NADH-quinone oxidoreductase subunit D [Candidatus Omnitrophica bacterium]|nr:NADH-quinone oxidoreductase subunit D [Candidatus Omnitrophota bacterium]
MEYKPLEVTRERASSGTESMRINMGPAHPAMHGVIRIMLTLDGETVTDAEVEIGYLHRAFEKMCEQGNYLQALPYTDRLNYVSPLINNFGYMAAVEKLFGLQCTERTQYIRVILSEISRITDHLTCIGASAMELGSFTAFLYLMKAREFLYELVEDVTGARLTVSYARVGGVKADLPAGCKEKTLKALAEVRKILSECDRLLTRNRIFVDRLEGVGVISKEDALAYGITGPFLRSTGVDYDVRKAQPYFAYDRVDFDVPVGLQGDNYDRYLVRMEEMRQSMRIIEQAFSKMKEGPVQVNPFTGEVIAGAKMVDEAKLGHTSGLLEIKAAVDPTLDGTSKYDQQKIYPSGEKEKRVMLPAKENTYGNIEGLMNHFKLIMIGHGIRPPKGEAYFPVEGGNGELGFYVISDGTDKPYRVRVRPPCLPPMAALANMIQGGTVADIIATFGSVNMIAGELDR